MEIFKGFFNKPERVWTHPSSGVKVSVANISSAEHGVVKERISNARQRLASQIHEQFVVDFTRSVADPSFEGPSNDLVMKNMTADEIYSGISHGIKQWEQVLFPNKSSNEKIS